MQRLLATLAVGRRCAEAGTAFGEGAVAIASTAVSLVTVESDASRASAARDHLAQLDNVELIHGDWREELPPRGPFELFFLDGGGYKQHPGALGPTAVGLLERGGVLVIDDLTPANAAHDPARAFLLEHPDLMATEIMTRPDAAAILAVHR